MAAEFSSRRRDECENMSDDLTEPFRVRCTSADRNYAAYMYFDSLAEADEWVGGAIKTDYGQIDIQENVTGRWVVRQTHYGKRRNSNERG